MVYTVHMFMSDDLFMFGEENAKSFRNVRVDLCFLRWFEASFRVPNSFQARMWFAGTHLASYELLFIYRNQRFCQSKTIWKSEFDPILSNIVREHATSHAHVLHIPFSSKQARSWSLPEMVLRICLECFVGILWHARQTGLVLRCFEYAVQSLNVLLHCHLHTLFPLLICHGLCRTGFPFHFQLLHAFTTSAHTM